MRMEAAVVKRLPDPVLVPDHAQAMAGPGREAAVDTPTNTYGTADQAGAAVVAELVWHEPGWRPR